MKLKTCDGCQKEAVIWKNHEGSKYCKDCWSCHKSKENKPQKPKLAPSSSIKKKSDKQKANRLFEEAVAVAASFACTVPDQESLLDLLFVGLTTVCVTAGRGVGHTEEMLETLACARPCRQPRWRELQDLVLRHSARVCGRLLVLLDWDPPRRELVRRLKALRVPVWALVIVPEGETTLPLAAAIEQPDRLVLLELGRVAEQLRQL